jgi:hypothetical protein
MYYRLWLGSGIRPPRTIPLGPQFINNGIEKSQKKAVSLGGIRQFARKEANRFAMVILRE